MRLCQQGFKGQDGVARTIQVDGQGALPLGITVFTVKRMLGAQACVIDQQQLVPCGQLHRRCSSAAGRCISYIECHGLCLAASVPDALGGVLGLVGVDVGGNHMRAHGGQPFGHGLTDALACAGDESGLLCEKLVHIHLKIPGDACACQAGHTHKKACVHGTQASGLSCCARAWL